MVKLLTAEELEKMNISEYHIKEYTFIMLGNRLVNIGKRKPGIERSIYYDDETPRPNINYEFFEYYNMKTAFGMYIKKDLIDEDLALIKNYKYWFNVTRYTYYNRTPDMIILTKDEKKQILAANKILVKDYEKRLKTYFKKYSDKIYTHGYWANR